MPRVAKHSIKGSHIKKVQFLRVRRICSNIIDFRQNSLMLLSHFIRRGYPHQLVTAAMRKAELQDRDSLIAKNAPTIQANKKNTPESQTNFYLVNTHNPANPPLRTIIENNWSLLNKSKTTRSLNEAKLIFGLCRNKNLSDQLVRASTRTINNPISNVERNPCQR